MAVLARVAVAVPVLCYALLGRPLNAQTSRRSLEYRVKAAYLLNFTRYVEWPPQALGSPSSPLVLCVYGDDPFGPRLEQTVRGRRSHGHPIEVRQVESTVEARECHVVFLSHAEWRGRPDILPALAGRGILTVGEGAAFTEAGGIIGFVTENQAVRFAVNVAAGEKAGLRLSSRMLALAARRYGEQRASQP